MATGWGVAFTVMASVRRSLSVTTELWATRVWLAPGLRHLRLPSGDTGLPSSRTWSAPNVVQVKVTASPGATV